MPRSFNTAGPCIAGDPYMLDPLARLDVEEVLRLIDAERCFVLHAPRQIGKTTCLLALMKRLNDEGRYRALYANIEAAQAARGDVAMGIGAVVQALAHQCRDLTGDASLLAWVDALVGDTLVSLLRQIRAGYAQRPGAFPPSVVLCGVRDVRDYRIHTGTQEVITGGLAFNIKAASLRLGNLSRDETVALWRQQQAETGQVFDPAIWPELWEDTRGQPWLVNALGDECTMQDRSARNRSVPITLERYKAARERLIQGRATHLDQLTDRGLLRRRRGA